MKQQALTYTAIALAGLAVTACGSPQDSETRTSERNGAGANRTAAADDGDMQALLEHVAAENDASFEPEVETMPDGNLQLDGPLAEGSWTNAGVGGMEYGPENVAPVAMLRCASDGSTLIAAVPTPPDPDAGASAPGVPDAPTAPSSQAGSRGSGIDPVAGSLITANGTATGMFEPVEGRDSWREMRISADEAVLDGIPHDGRIGVGLEGEDTRLMPVTGTLLDALEVCVDPADSAGNSDSGSSDS